SARRGPPAGVSRPDEMETDRQAADEQDPEGDPDEKPPAHRPLFHRSSPVDPEGGRTPPPKHSTDGDRCRFHQAGREGVPGRAPPPPLPCEGRVPAFGEAQILSRPVLMRYANCWRCSGPSRAWIR